MLSLPQRSTNSIQRYCFFVIFTRLLFFFLHNSEKSTTFAPDFHATLASYGAVGLSFGALAHLVERFVRNEEVGGSSPLCSTFSLPFFFYFPSSSLTIPSCSLLFLPILQFYFSFFNFLFFCRHGSIIYRIFQLSNVCDSYVIRM